MIVAIGTRKGLWLATREGDEWTVTGPEFAMSEVPAILWRSHDGETPTLLVSAMSPHWGATVASSDDLGATWQETEGGALRFGPDDGASLERVWQLQSDPRDPETVWAGCEPTSLWRSTDGGAHFDLVRSLWDHPHRPNWAPGFGGAAVHTIVPREGESTVIAMSTGGVYRSDDDGASWRPTNAGISARFNPDPYPEYGQCVHKVAADAREPHRLFAQNHHGVYRSDDDGLTWTSIADGLPSDFGFVMVAHPTATGTAWVIPLEADMRRLPPDGRLRVWRTDDAGATWTPNDAGLPDECWTVTLRDAADACLPQGSDEAVVAFGTRDGCVYVSEDDGRTFAEIASHLPDVLCVRAWAD